MTRLVPHIHIPVGLSILVGSVIGVCVGLQSPCAAVLTSYVMLVIAAFAWSWRRGYFPKLIFLIYLAYGLVGPAVQLMHRDGSQDVLVKATGLFEIGFFGLFVGMAATLRGKGQTAVSVDIGGRLGSVVLYTILGALYVFQLSRIYGSVGTLYSLGRVLASTSGAGGGTIVYGLGIMLTASSLAVFYTTFECNRLLAWFAVGVPCVFFLSVGMRKEAVLISLGVVVALLRQGWKIKASQFIFLTLAAYVVVGPVGWARLYWHRGLREVVANFSWEWLDLGRSDLGAGIKTLVTLLNNRFSEWKCGATYLQALVNSLPWFLQPISFERPAIWYLETYLPDYYRAGFGAGFSPVTEAFMNFGLIGPLPVMTVVGCTLGVIRTVCSRSRGVSLVLIEVVTVVSFLNFNRIDFSGWLSQYLFSLLTVFAVSVIGKPLRPNKSGGRYQTRPCVPA